MENLEKAEEELSGYESESEDYVLALAMRRREASDDDDESGESDKGERHFGGDLTVGVYSYGESSDGLCGMPPESDGEEIFSTYEESEFEDEGDQFGEADNVERHFGADRTVGESSDGFGGAPPQVDGESCTDEGIEFEEGEESQESGEEGVETAPVRQVVEKKELTVTEPYVIPTVGAFYTHDDRYIKHDGRRNSQKLGGGNLWQFKDESKWGHDKFEELTLQETHSKEEDRTTKGCGSSSQQQSRWREILKWNEI